MKKENLTYETPAVTVMEVAVEKGFAQSQSGGGSLDNDFGREGW